MLVLRLVIRLDLSSHGMAFDSIQLVRADWPLVCSRLDCGGDTVPLALLRGWRGLLSKEAVCRCNHSIVPKRLKRPFKALFSLSLRQRALSPLGDSPKESGLDRLGDLYTLNLNRLNQSRNYSSSRLSESRSRSLRVSSQGSGAIP